MRAVAPGERTEELEELEEPFPRGGAGHGHRDTPPDLRGVLPRGGAHTHETTSTFTPSDGANLFSLHSDPFIACNTFRLNPLCPISIQLHKCPLGYFDPIDLFLLFFFKTSVPFCFRNASYKQDVGGYF